MELNKRFVRMASGQRAQVEAMQDRKSSGAGLARPESVSLDLRLSLACAHGIGTNR